MEKTIPVSQLANSAMTRQRGREASTRLLSYLDSYDSIQIDSRATDLVSSSYLDEIVLNLKAAGAFDRVVFLVSDQTVLHRLAGIAAVRDARIFYRTNPRSPKDVVRPHPVQAVELRRAKA
jgi:hypothetical protein